MRSFGERRGVGGRIAQAISHFSRLTRRLSAHAPREGNGTGQQIAVDQLIDDSPFVRLLGGDRIAHRAHLGRVDDAGQSRQPLRPGRAGDDAELDLRLANLGVRDSDAVMAGLCDFESAAEGRAVDRTHDRLGTIFDRQECRIEADLAALFARRDFAELLDVGTGDERLAAADEHDRFHRGIGTRRLHVGQNAFRDARAECVDRRIIHGDDRHVALFRECHQVAHGWLFFLAESFSPSLSRWGESLCYRERV